MKAIALGTVLAFMSSCYCFKAEHRDEPKCIVAQRILECTKDSVLSVLPAALAVISALIAGGSADLDSLYVGLRNGGFDNALCILGSLQDLFMGKVPALPPNVTKQFKAKYKLVWK